MSVEAQATLKNQFMQVVIMFSTNAMVSLGKMPNPINGKTEKNLEQARMMIDFLEMFKSKTAGNIDAEETKLLDESLAGLRMGYVEAAN